MSLRPTLLLEPLGLPTIRIIITGIPVFSYSYSYSYSAGASLFEHEYEGSQKVVGKPKLEPAQPIGAGRPLQPSA
jgi:hypothetical protein